MFDVENAEDTYFFAKDLFYEIVEHSGPEVEVFVGWDPVVKERHEAMGKNYYLDKEHAAEYDFDEISYDNPDASSFRMEWKYMPQFSVLSKSDYMKTMAVFLMLFVFIAIVCFAAVIVILYTRSITIAMSSKQVYDDLRHLGASPKYLYKTVKGQTSKVFFAPIFTGTCIISAFFLMILYFNDGKFLPSEYITIGICLIIIACGSALFYLIYRATLKKVGRILEI